MAKYVETGLQTCPQERTQSDRPKGLSLLAVIARKSSDEERGNHILYPVILTLSAMKGKDLKVNCKILRLRSLS